MRALKARGRLPPDGPRREGPSTVSAGHRKDSGSHPAEERRKLPSRVRMPTPTREPAEASRFSAPASLHPRLAGRGFTAEQGPSLVERDRHRLRPLLPMMVEGQVRGQWPKGGPLPGFQEAGNFLRDEEARERGIGEGPSARHAGPGENPGYGKGPRGRGPPFARRYGTGPPRVRAALFLRPARAGGRREPFQILELPAKVFTGIPPATVWLAWSGRLWVPCRGGAPRQRP